MSTFPATTVRWSVAAFPAADPADVAVVSGEASWTLRARRAAADAGTTMLFELDDTGLLFVSVTVGFTDAMAAIDPAGLNLSECQRLVDRLVDLDRPLRSWRFES